MENTVTSLQTSVRFLFTEVVKTEGDVRVMGVLADALFDLADSFDEVGEYGRDKDVLALGSAYRFAAKHNLWPFKKPCDNVSYYRPTRKNYVSGARFIYDWDVVGRATLPGAVSDRARLPKPLYHAMVDLPDKRYGGVNKAFILLARSLSVLRDLVESC